MDYKMGSKKSLAKTNLVLDKAILITILSNQDN